jgi:hypothetical protein
MSSESSTPSLTIAVGAPPFRSALPQDQPVLVIEADPQRLSQLQLDLNDQEKPVNVVVEVITAEAGTAVEWHHYNDARLDGPVGLASWQSRYPNLRLLGKDQRRGRPLKDLIQAWADEHAPHQPLLLSLELRQGDPLAALIGLGPWTPSLQQVRLDMPLALDEGLSGLNQWLAGEGFTQIAGAIPTWERDPVATLQRLVERQSQQLVDMERLLQDVTSQRDHQQAHALDLQEQLEQTNRAIHEILMLLDHPS